MKKIYSLMLLFVALTCVPWSAKGAVTVLDEGFESNSLATNGWTKAGTSQSSSGINSSAKHTGSYGYRFYYAKPSQYLISKELSVPSNASDLRIEFYYKTPGSYGPEKFKVGYSTTTNDVTGDGVFTWDTEIETSVTEWTEYTSTTNSFTIPTNVKYIAIAYTANNTYYLYVDDIKLTCEVNGPAMSIYDGESAIASGYNYNFGLATAGTTKTFTLKNDGTEATPVAVSHTGSFGAELSAASIPAGGEVTLTVTMPATSGDDVITISSTAEGIDDFVINVSGTVRDASKLWCNFSEGLPEGWTNSSYTINTTGAGAGTSGGGYAGNTSYSSYRLSTPKVTFAENEKMFLLVAGSSSYSTGTVQIQYSADGTNWTDAKTVSGIAYGSWTNVEVTEIPAGTYYIGFYGRYYYLTDIYGGTPVAMPKNVAAAGVTDTEATISWTAHGSETAWQVSYSTTSGDPDHGTIVDATSTSKALEGLSATTTYYVSVRIGDSGEWSNEISFTTECGATIAPYTWTFDGLSDGTVPNCWDNSGSGTSTTGSYLWSVYKIYNTTKYMLRLYNSLVQKGTALINTPRIVLPASPAYEFAFDYSHKASCGAFTVKVSEDGGVNWTDLQSYTNETGGNATSPDAELIEASIDLTSYAGKTIILQFYAMADYNEGAIFVDNVAVRVKSSCPAPKNVLASSVTDHTASVTWTEKGEATAWKLQTSTDGNNWGDEIAANANPFTLTGLNAATTYYVRVKAACGESESSEWSDASEAFTTKCEAKTLPFATEEFTTIPSCWSVDPEWQLYSYDGSIRVKSSTASLTMPLIVLSEKAQLSFRHSAGDSSVKCYVYVNDGESEEKAGEVTSSTSWKQATVDLADYIGKTVNIIFRSSTSSYNLYIDDVAVNYLPVNAPANVVASPANASAKVTWESNEEGAKFNIRYRLTSEENWTEVDNISEKTYTIDGLTNEQAYEVQVKAVASANRQSEWSASANVTPVDCPTVQEITFGARTFSSIVVNWTANAEASSWILRFQQGESGWSARINCTEKTYTLTDLAPNVPYTVIVKASCGDDKTYVTSPEFLLSYTAPEVGEPTNITETEATFTWSEVADADGVKKYEYAVVNHGESATGWTGTDETTVTVNTLNPGTEYDFFVRAKYSSGVSDADTIEFSTITIKPTELVATAITDESAKLTWSKTGIQPANFQYATAPDAEEWTNVAGTQLEVTLTGLTANTSYTYYLRTAYDNSVKSESASVTFKTACTAYVVDAENPFTEDFNGLTAAGTIPECWDNAEGTTTNANYKWSYSASGHDGSCVCFESDYNPNDATNVLATPTIQLDVEATLKFWCKNAKGGAFEVKISANGGERETLLSGLTSISSWTEKEVDLSDYTGKSVVLYFCGTSNYATGGLICLDDVNITAIPACGTPKNVQATNVLCNTATITWEKGGKETAWIVEYATNEDFTEGLVEKNADATSLALTGLTTNTKYYVRVKGDCESATYSEVINFTPAYIAPSNVAVSEIEKNTAKVDWTANSGETAWTVQYKKAADAEWTSIENVDAHPYVLTGLAASTNYQVRVLAGEEASTTESFTTECAAIAALPWSENFEGQTLDAAPACWEVVDPNNTNIYVSTGSQWFDLGTTGLFFEGANANYGYILLPEFEVALNTLQISFSHSEEHSSKSGKIELGYYQDGEFTSLKAYDQSQKAWKAEGPFALTNVPAGARLAFGYKTNSNTYAAAIDNITIEEIPACAVPTDLAASEVTAATATLSWTSEATNFKVQYTTDKDNWGEEHEVEGTNYVINGLTEHTTYYAHVKAVCGEASESEYCEEISFTTSWAAQSYPYAYSFGETLDARWSVVENHGSNTWTMSSEDENYFAQYKTTNNGFNHSVLQTPEVTIPSESDPYLIFNWRNTGADAEVKISVNGAAAVVLDADFNTELSTVTDTWALKKVSLAAYKGQTVRILFNAISGTANKYAELDEVRFDEKPCLVPTDLKASATEGGASITWTAAWDETSWNLQYKKTSEDAGQWQLIENVTENPYNLSGLTYNVEYEVQIQAICGENVSEWSASATFTPTKSTGMDELNGTESVGTKIMENGVLYIIRDGIKYNAQGARVSQN